MEILTINWNYQSMIKSTWDLYALVGSLINTFVQSRIQTSDSYKNHSMSCNMLSQGFPLITSKDFVGNVKGL